MELPSACIEGRGCGVQWRLNVKEDEEVAIHGHSKNSAGRSLWLIDNVLTKWFDLMRRSDGFLIPYDVIFYL